MDFGEIELGVALMDEEHHRMAELFDAFERGFRDHTPVDDMICLVEEALELTNAHFAHEEALMEAAHYPGLADHRVLHRNVRMQLTALVADTTAYFHMHDPVTMENLATMRQVLSRHVAGPDMALATFLKTAPAAAA